MYGCTGFEIIFSTGPCSTTLPAYITQILFAIPATTAKSCVIQRRAVSGVFAEFLHLIDHLSLNCDVKGRGGLIGNNKIWFVQHCNRDRDTLSHSTRKLVWVGSESFLR